MARTLATRPRSAATSGPPESQADGAVRRLIQLSRAAAEAGADGPGAVVLDICVDGYRCVLIHQPQPAAPPPEECVLLSPREQEIARMVAKGFPNKMIARVLEISTWTVGTYLRRIFAKLAVSSRAAMVAKLLEGDPCRSDQAQLAGVKLAGPRDPHREVR